MARLVKSNPLSFSIHQQRTPGESRGFLLSINKTFYCTYYLVYVERVVKAGRAGKRDILPDDERLAALHTAQGFIPGDIPVSYTHLDVYKRQSHRHEGHSGTDGLYGPRRG